MHLGSPQSTLIKRFGEVFEERRPVYVFLVDDLCSTWHSSSLRVCITASNLARPFYSLALPLLSVSGDKKAACASFGLWEIQLDLRRQTWYGKDVSSRGTATKHHWRLSRLWASRDETNLSRRCGERLKDASSPVWRPTARSSLLDCQRLFELAL